MPIQARCQQSMVLPHGAVANQYQLQILTREAGFGEGNKFRNRIILAIAFPDRECGKRCSPPIDFTM